MQPNNNLEAESLHLKNPRSPDVKMVQASSTVKNVQREQKSERFIRKYKRAMDLEEANEAALCKCFEVAFTRPASSWYNSIPPIRLFPLKNLVTNSPHILSGVSGPLRGQFKCSTSSKIRTRASRSSWRDLIGKQSMPLT